MGRRLLYTSASFSGQADFVSQKSCICAATHVTKPACPTDAEKRLPTAICSYSRWRSQPLSRVSRKQRYNTLDFAEQNRVPRWTLSPVDTLCQQGCSRPFWMTQSRKAGAALLWKPPEFSASVSIQTAKSQWGYHALKIKKDRTLFYK